MMGAVDTDVLDYLDGIAPEQRPLFDRVRALITGLHPDVELVLSYKMPTFVVGERRLHVGVWKHGVSLYGWDGEDDGGFVARHPELSSGKGTLRIPSAGAEEIADDELLGVLRGALGPSAAP